MKSFGPFRAYVFWFSLLVLGLTSCNTTKYLDFDQAFLVENKIEFSSEYKIKKKGKLKSELARLYKQRPNENFFFVPREWYYYRSQDTVGKSKFVKSIKRWQLNQFGEEPAIFNRELTEATKNSMRFYLQHKGFFDANVRWFFDYKGKKNKKVIVTYEVLPEQRYLIDTTDFYSRDSAIHSILQKISSNTLLTPGSPVDVNLYEKEVRRITTHLRNRGYAYFQPNFISELTGDSSNQQVRLQLKVFPPPGDTIHRTYRIGNIYIYPQYDPASNLENQIDTIQPGIFLVSKDGSYGVKPKTILNALFFEKGALYSQEAYDKTNRKFSDLGIFRFVTIRDEPDPDNPGYLNFQIFLTPNKRFEFGINGEINTSNSPTFIGQRVIGVSSNLTLRHRNLLKGAELFVSNLEGGLDFNINQLDSLINTVDVRIQGELYYPKFVDYFGLWHLLNRLKLVTDPFITELEERATTRQSISYNYLERINFYRINSFNATYGYDFNRSNRKRYRINHFGIDYLSPTRDSAFDALINQNEFLRRSFDKQLFTGFLFRDFSYNYASIPNRFGESFAADTRIEISGGEVQLTNWLYNSLVKPENRDTFALRFPNDTVRFFNYIKFELDLRHYRQINTRQTLALRLYAGLATPFGFSSEVPFVKQFFVGGPQSIRAWAVREIGPGGFYDPPAVQNTTFFYQSGDFKLEFNAEYRFHLLTIFSVRYEGALFLDVGNIYTLKEDPSRPLSQLLWNPKYNDDNEKVGDNFIRYLAVGTGFGLRLDFTYFILRLDMGFPLRNPFPTYFTDDNNERVERFWIDPSSYQLNDLNFNLSLGYPF